MRFAAASLLLLALLAPAQAPTTVTAAADAVRLNNLGVASMNQQKFEVALKYFQDASARDQGLTAAMVNQAVALLALQRYEPAQQVLEAAVKADDRNVRAWYNLGLLQKGLGNADAALAAFTRATELLPSDPHAHYFVGLIDSQLQQYDKAIPAFTKALEIDPYLVSAEFGLARAYQRSGKPDDAKTHMDRFTRVTQEKVASAMSLAYGDQGKLSLAEAVRPPAAGSTAIPVSFVADDKTFVASAPLSAAAAGPGGCELDADGDGAIDYVRLTAVGAQFVKNSGKGQFAAPVSLTTEGAIDACAVADYDNDERPDIALASANKVWLFHNDGDGVFSDASSKAAIPALTGGWAQSLAFIDIDHDADVDLVVTGAKTMLFRNNGNGTFSDVTDERGLGIAHTKGVIASDLNNDRAIDLVLTGERTTILLNPREGVFKPLDAFKPAAPANTRGVVALDFDKDGWMDLAITSAGAPGLTLWRNVNGTSFERVDLPSPLADGYGVAAIDYDNDGWVDLAAVGGGADAGVLQVLRNVQGHFVDVSASVGATKLALKNPRALLAGDVDQDNDTDLVVTQGKGAPPVILRNDGGNANHAIRVALTGLADNRSGVGTKVEVQAGASWQKFETVSASGFLGQSSPEILAGIGQATEADVVRLLWPTGVVQDEVQLAADKRHAITEIDRRGSSCPILFSWNGTKFEFISDAVGPAVIGHWIAPGQYSTPDTDEFVKVEGSKLRARDGKLSLHFIEPMEEINYLDEVRLYAVDHPDGTEIYPNEYFAAEPPFPADRTIATRNARLPQGAWDEKGRDLMPALRAADRRFVDTFADAPFKGFASLHALELDLGVLNAGDPVRLLMRGFTDYFTATSMYAADQAKVKVIVPYVEAQRADGSWARVSDDIGFPAGLLRTMVADLSGKLPPGTRRIRIWTNLKIYWDQVLIDTMPDGAIPVTRTEVPLVAASLSRRGYPREILGTPAADIRYDFNVVSQSGPYARHRGFYTKFGDVTSLLRRSEDHFVIFGSGEDVAVDFDATKLPPVKPGWTRDYEIYLNGFVKDMDFWGAFAQTVAPLPFRAMPSYPYPSATAYPDRNREYQLEWNTREVTDEAPASYRFDYGDKPRRE
jgi:lipoprotein NlpI